MLPARGPRIKRSRQLAPGLDREPDGEPDRGAGQVRELDDAELLALAAPKPVALVRLSPNAAELVFANPDDQKEVFGN